MQTIEFHFNGDMIKRQVVPSDRIPLQGISIQLCGQIYVVEEVIMNMDNFLSPIQVILR